MAIGWESATSALHLFASGIEHEWRTKPSTPTTNLQNQIDSLFLRIERVVDCVDETAQGDIEPALQFLSREKESAIQKSLLIDSEGLQVNAQYSLLATLRQISLGLKVLSEQSHPLCTNHEDLEAVFYESVQPRLAGNVS